MSNRHKHAASYWRQRIEDGRCAADDPRAVAAIDRQRRNAARAAGQVEAALTAAGRPVQPRRVR